MTSVRTVSTNCSAKRFARGLRVGIFTASIPASARAASTDAVNRPAGPGPGTEVRGAIPQIHQQVADLLHGPRTVRVRGDPGYVHVAAADLQDEQAVQALLSLEPSAARVLTDP